MDKTKVVISIFFLPFLISFSAKSSGNPGFSESTSNLDSMHLAFEQRILNTANDSVKSIESHFDFGEHLANEGDMEASIEQFKIALRIAKNINDDTQIAKVANYLANMYAAIGDFTTSNQIYQVALASAERTQNSGEIAKISMNLASNYNYTGDYEKATKHGLYALKTKETTNNLTRICYHYIAMGNIFRENNNTVKWEEYVQKAYKMKDVEGCASFGDLAKIYNSLGGIAVQKGELEKGLLYYDTLLTLSKELEYDQGISTALSNSAGIYKELDNFDKAMEMANEAERYFGGNPYDILFSNNFKAELYQIEGDFKKGLELVNANIQSEEINNYSTEKLKTLQLLYELNFNLGNYDEAFFWNDSLRNAESRLRDEDIRQSLEELETKYETEKKQQQIELLTTENKLRKRIMQAGIVIVVILVLLVVLIFYTLQIRKKQAEFVHNNLRQKVLRSQMNPHFIFNVLGSIQNFMLQNDTRKASNYLSQFALLTRATLNNSAEETISLADEIEMLKNYIDLEKMRKGDQFDYEIICDDNLETDFIQIPPMLIQPFVENSIKHGFKTIENKGLLSLRFSDEGKKLSIEITDNGIGIKKAAQIKPVGHSSKAMQIFEERRKLFAKKTKQQIEFTITDRSVEDKNQQGTRVQIVIPIDINY